MACTVLRWDAVRWDRFCRAQLADAPLSGPLETAAPFADALWHGGPYCRLDRAEGRGRAAAVQPAEVRTVVRTYECALLTY